MLHSVSNQYQSATFSGAKEFQQHLIGKDLDFKGGIISDIYKPETLKRNTDEYYNFIRPNHTLENVFKIKNSKNLLVKLYDKLYDKLGPTLMNMYMSNNEEEALQLGNKNKESVSREMYTLAATIYDEAEYGSTINPKRKHLLPRAMSRLATLIIPGYKKVENIFNTKRKNFAEEQSQKMTEALLKHL